MWFLSAEYWAIIKSIVSSGIKADAIQNIEMKAISGIDESGAPYIYKSAGPVAEITVEGILTENFDINAYFSGAGNTTYKNIRSSLAIAEGDDEIKGAILRIGSPGGHVVGMFETIDAIREFSKPIKAIVGSQACSAAYALAAATGNIIASVKSASFGSIGIVMEYKIEEDMITIASTKAPKKAPDATTEEGKAVIREYADQLHTLFAESIATSRGTTVEKVNSDYGQGAIVLAETALKNGMIDEILTSSNNKPVASKTNSKGAKAMDVEKLKLEHPAVYNAIFALGEANGVKVERDRASAHLTLGESCGAVDVAVKAVKEGTAMTQTITAEYLAAGMNKKDTTDRAADEAAAAAAAGGAAAPTEAEKDAVANASLLKAAQAKCGVEVTA